MKIQIFYFSQIIILLVTICLANPAHAQTSLASDTTQVNSDVINLNEVIVTATRTNKTLKNTPVITQVITAKQIENRGFTDIKTLLMQEVPGLSFQEVGFGTSILIQGLDAKHILFLIDGERIAGETGNNIDYSRLNLDNIERVEIVKGASSSIYGSQAMGGVINIITKNARKKVEINVGGRYGQANQQNYKNVSKDDTQYKFRTSVDKPNLNGNISLGLNLNKFKAYTDVVYKSFDGYQLYDSDSLIKYYPQYDTTVIENKSNIPSSISGYQDLNISQKLSYAFNDKWKLSAKGAYYELNKYDFTPNNKYENAIDLSYGANLDYQIDGVNNLSFSYYADNYKRYDKYELLDEKDLSYKNDLIQPKIIFNTSAWKNQVLTTGVEYLQESLYGDQFESGQLETKSQWNATAFLQDDWTLNKKINVIGGLRVDYHERYGWNASPKLSLMYKIFPVTLRLNYAKGFRSPSLKELYMNWDHLGMFWIYGNENLKPETNNYVSLSGEYVSSWLYATFTGYGNWFRNKIEGVWSNNQTEYHYVNIGKTTLAGLEATTKIKIVKNLFVHGAFNYLYSKDNSGVKLSTASPLSGNLRLEYSFSKGIYDAHVNLSASFMGQKDYNVADELTINGTAQETYYEAHVNAYSMLNCAFTQQFYKSIRLTLGVNNLLDYQASIVNFNTSTSPGRRFYVALNLSIHELVSIF